MRVILRRGGNLGYMAMRNTKILVLAVLTVGLAAASFSADAQNRYRWTGEDGSTRISDRIPPDAAKYRIEVLNARGLVVRVIEAQLTEEQRVEAERQAQLEEEARLARENQARHDHMLLQSYTSVADIERARDGRVQALEAQIRVAQAAGVRLQANHDELQAQIERLEGAGRPVPEDLTQRLAATKEQLDANQRFVDTRERELDELLSQFETDIERYQELRGIR